MSVKGPFGSMFVKGPQKGPLGADYGMVGVLHVPLGACKPSFPSQENPCHSRIHSLALGGLSGAAV